MNEKYRVSLDIAKQLQCSLYEQEGNDAYWCKGYCLSKWTLLSSDELDRRIDLLVGSERIEYIAAPCVGRLGEDLLDFHDARHRIMYYVGERKEWGNYSMNITADSEADARGMMWIKLKKKGLL